MATGSGNAPQQGNTCKPPPIGCGAFIGRIKNVVTYLRFRESGLCKACQDKVYKR